jgi:prephenate dehydrogenase
MTIQITIIGLGQIGTSIGLSLASQTERIKRVGHDREVAVQNKAKSMGAFDAVNYNLPASVENADVVLLCIPLDQIEETLKFIAPDLREDTIVMDFSPQKTVVHRWFQQHIPAGRHYVGLVAAINPELLYQPHQGIESASADLFEKATIGIVAPSGTPGKALELADDLVKLLGAKTIFLDMQEADGMMMMAHLLPQMMSVALLNATVGQPGWTEARRFAGRSFAMSTAPIGDDPAEALEQVLLNNPATTIRALDMAIGALTHLREAVNKGDKADIERRLHLASDDRKQWLNERHRAEWNEETVRGEMPSPGDAIKHLFLGGRPKPKGK